MTDTLDIAYAAAFTLPVYYDGVHQADDQAGTFAVTIDGRRYLTEGVIVVETEHYLVACHRFEAEETRGVRVTPARKRHTSDYEKSEQEAIDAAEHEQRLYAQEIGLVFPIWLRD